MSTDPRNLPEPDPVSNDLDPTRDPDPADVEEDMPGLDPDWPQTTVPQQD